jgi:ATP-dependent RNA helicase DeaD
MRSDIQKIFNSLPTDKQVMMFSSRLNIQLKDIYRKFLRNPFELFSDERVLKSIEYYYMQVSRDGRLCKLEELLKTYSEQVVIYTNDVSSCKDLTARLKKGGYNCLPVHAEMSQDDRYFNTLQ